ncbi:hypothetical protein IRP63_05520 [Clostridium botulinum]|uniref:Restriction endonuclease type IV Mrr domain-containing protein n=1 Tax=Clostridium botulinum C/D str. DC5 TaxID=1443128 RepID=A0A0A0IKV9_CLOBO|nr:hypothetical protein [Clostridium botulinum]KGN01214.1 hypothetical protein Z955_01375 [Clostridium botulinum C/D str. DC5]KOC53958.1 hypothetical protein ADU89_08005 [Clostridium botulinum]KOC57871.1 hypothetical protein ADU90_03980 [Clostridium botulinum]MCD3232854.1 hypothetical protein [Clostridium botulinum D/C]MCD3238714.1 hypothetical protein [Clostridium botulinum D/C]
MNLGMKRNGFKTKDVFLSEINDYFDSEEDFVRNLTCLKGKTLEQFNNKLNLLESLNEQKAKNNIERGKLSNEKGTVLEELTKILIKGTSILKTYGNVGTATNEIDVIVAKNYKGERIMSMLKKESLFVEFENYMICECKNYNKKIPATWVGKFFTLLKTCGECPIGIIFSYKGLSGNARSWTDAHGLTKILHSISHKKYYIIDFNYDDFKKIAKGYNFFEILKEKKLSLSIGADVSKYILPHKNQNDLLHKLEEI